MRTYKFLLLTLFFLIAASLIFNVSGVGNLETFYNFSEKQSQTYNAKYNLESLSAVFARYPPGVFAVFSLILNFFKPDASLPLFYKQTAWVFHKYVLFIFYLLTGLALLNLAKHFKSKKLSLLDVSIAYFASISILLLSVALTYFDILAAPLILLSLNFLFRRRFNLAATFYLFSLFFSWPLSVFGLPLFLYHKRKDLIKPLPLFGFLIFPLTVLAWHFVEGVNITPSVVFGFPWFINPGLSGLVEAGFIGMFTILSIGFLLRIFFPATKKIGFGVYLIPVALFSLPFFLINSFLPIFAFLFFLFYLRLSSLLISVKRLSKFDFTQFLFSLYLFFILFFSGISPGALVWLTLIALVLFILRRTKFTSLQLFLVNLLVFVNVFVFYGTAGLPPVRGDYFDFFRAILAASFIIFAVWYPTLRGSPANALKWMKRFAVFFIILLILALIPAEGSPDTVSWAQYTTAVTENDDNPFLAQVLEDQRYPPISTVILGIFATVWKNLIGVSKTYAISTKISIFVFYILTVVSYLKFGVAANKSKNLSLITKLLVVLTTFSLIVQTQGLADLNIYILPPLFAAITALFKKKYFLSGILLGIAVSIKWQPVILIPLFGATLFNFDQNIKVSLKRSAVFLSGFLPIPLIAWYLVLIQPGGLAAIGRSFDYLFQGAPMLSGQALNLNWIVTYLIHIFQPDRDVSLAHLGGLNRQIPTGIAPIIFQGYLFVAAALVILWRYWLFQKKNLSHFLSAATMIFFSHQILNKSAYEKHLFYTVALMLFLYLVRPTKGNRNLVILFDIMTMMNLVFFYGFTGGKWFNRLFLGVDLTVIFAAYYVVVFAWVFWRYFRHKGLLFG